MPVEVSVLFNEPKLLKCFLTTSSVRLSQSFSALQRAEIAEIFRISRATGVTERFSALQRAEIAEMKRTRTTGTERGVHRFSALQRAEIAEIEN